MRGLLDHSGFPEQTRNETILYRKDLTHLWHIHRFVMTCGGDTEETLAYLLHLANARCSRPHDYIYAMLGLATDYCRREIRPSYDRSGCEFICHAIRWMAVESPGSQSDGARSPNAIWSKRCSELAEDAQHNPFDNSSHMIMKRERCSGLLHDPEACSKDSCSGQHCDALVVCREIAKELFTGEFADILVTTSGNKHLN